MLDFMKTIINSLKAYIDKKLKNSVSDWNQNDSSADGYIKNRPFYEEVIYETLIPETTVNITSDNSYESLPDTPVLTIGQTYRVILNGVEYICVARQYGDEDALIGNGDIYGDDGISNGEPFACDSYASGSFYLNTALAGEYTFSLDKVTTVIKKIDEKYLPEIDVENFVKPLPVYRRNYYPSESEDQFVVNILELEHGYTYGLIPYDDAVLSNVTISLMILCDNGEEKHIDNFNPNELIQVFKRQGEIDLKLRNQTIGLNITDISTADSVNISYNIYNTAYLGINNQEEYIPGGDYNPATKKYVDDVKTYVDDKSNEILTGKHTFTHFVMKDTVTGFNYIVEMNNGSLISYCGDIVSATLTSLPTKTDYVAGENFDATGMVIMVECADGFVREAKDGIDYICPEVVIDSAIVITCGNHNFKIEVTLQSVENALVDFNYTINDDGTYTITGWKQTLNGEPSTEMIVPNSSLVII